MVTSEIGCTQARQKGPNVTYYQATNTSELIRDVSGENMTTEKNDGRKKMESRFKNSKRRRDRNQKVAGETT